jgi:hypothetical protein
MRRLLLLSALLAGLSACASEPTVYQPAAGPGAVGYFETPIEHDRWRVAFHGGGGASVQQVGDMALHRAADLTLAKGYDWFRITERQVDGAGGGPHPDLSFGFGGANGGGYSSFGVGTGVGFEIPVGQSVTVTLEILMGHGPAPREPDAYDARDLRHTFGQQA